MPTGAAPLGGYLVALYNLLLGAVGIIAMMMLVYGGFLYMTSAGNPTAMGDAKDIVYSAIIGLALALVSYLIISAINPELLFTQDPMLTPAGSPEYSINLPANSCSYNVSGFEPDECHCIGYTELFPARRDCSASKSFYNWTGTCDDLCKNMICTTLEGRKCCVKADLRVGTIPTDVTEKTIKVDVNAPVFFDILSNSVSCIEDYPIRGASVDAEKSWFDFGGTIAEYVKSFDTDTTCHYAFGVEKTPCDPAFRDGWCEGGPGRFTYSYSSAGTYYPELSILFGNDDMCENAKDETVTIIVE